VKNNRDDKYGKSFYAFSRMAKSDARKLLFEILNAASDHTVH
jgi:hypothetical protein